MDREKVIKGLEHCSKHDGSECPQCPYFKCECTDDLMTEALVLLKEQRAVKPIKQMEENEWTVCGYCKNHIISKWSFCPYCGRSVRWE